MKLNTVENFAMPNPINTNILDLLRTNEDPLYIIWAEKGGEGEEANEQ